MFKNWGFLLTEIWILLAIAALFGLFVGWLIWGRRSTVAVTQNDDQLRALQASLDACQRDGAVMSQKLGRAQDDLAALQPKTADATASISAEVAARFVAAPKRAAPPPAVAPEVTPAEGSKQKPVGLSQARDGKADDLKLIKGVGPKLEQLCHRLGFFHFDQIANWTASEIAWVDDNLEGFKGRVTRDEWVQQARDLAAGKPARPGGEH